MRNKHRLDLVVELKCPYESCGRDITRHVVVEYVTDQRGDVIEQKIK